MKNKYLNLFLTMLKIGLFTFGGGYAMLALLEHEFVEKKQWLEKDEFLNMAAIAESTPGPIAINSATYIGYKIGKFWGSLLATIGVFIPSFIIIFVISIFLDQFLSLEYVNYAFKGIQIGVIFLIMYAGFNMFKKMDKTALNIIICVITIVCMTVFAIINFSFSSIFYIIIFGVLGIFIYLLTKIKGGKKS